MHPQCCNEVFHLAGRFSGNPSLAVFSNSMGSKRVFHWRKLPFFWRAFHHRNATKLQICKSKVAIVAMRHGRAYLVEVGILLAGCTWEEHQHHTILMSKICQFTFPETNSLPLLEMKGWKLKFIEISFWGPGLCSEAMSVSGNEKLQTFQFDHLIGIPNFPNGLPLSKLIDALDALSCVHMHMQSPDCPVTATCKGNGGIWQLWRLTNMSMTSMTSFASLRNMSLQAASGQIWEEINQISRCNAKCGHFRWQLCTIWAKMHLFQILSWRLVTTWWHETSVLLTPLTVTNLNRLVLQI